MIIIVRNPRKIPTALELNQVVKCESSLIDGKEKTQLYSDDDRSAKSKSIWGKQRKWKLNRQR